MQGDARLARLIVAGCAVLALACPSAAAAAGTGKRVTIAVTGDSVVESSLTAGGATRGLAPQVADAFARRGFARGGQGFVATMLPQWSFSRVVAPTHGPPPRGTWALFGYGQPPFADGMSGYSALAAPTGATASVRVSGPDVGVLYTSTPTSTPFTVAVAGRTFRLDARAAGRPHASVKWIRLPAAGRRTLTIRGPSRGALTLGGVIDRRPVPAGRIQVETHNLGHVRQLPQEALAPRIVGAVAAQRFDVTVFLWSYVSEIVSDPAAPPSRMSAGYERSLLSRARLARRHGGACVVADTTPIPVARAVALQYSAIHARVARAAGCTHTKVLVHLWKDWAHSWERGETLIDRIHPTLSGYQSMAEALEPVLEPLVSAAAAR